MSAGKAARIGKGLSASAVDSATAASVVGPALGLKAHYIAQPESSGTIMPSVVVTAPDNPETGSVTYGVTVTGDGTDGTPSGDFTISDGVNACSGTLDGSGTGSCSLTEYAAYGLYTLTASYDGDSVYTSAESDPLDVTLATATPSVLLTGQDEGSGVVDYSVTVNGPGGAVVPTGTVTISDADGDTCTTDTLEGGSGGCSITFGSSGPFAVSAQYGGDGNYAPATGWPTPNVSVSDNSATTYYGGNLVFIVTVAGPGPAVTPTGSVSWALTGPGDPSCSDSGLVDGTASCSVSPAQVGAYTATATYLGDGNYSGAFGADSAATVSPATLTVTASSAQFTYGAAVPTITPSYSGFASGESALDLRPAPTCSTTATQSSPVGSYTSSCSGGVDGNYSFSYVAGTVKVARADLTITASDGSFTYGGSPPDIAAEYSGFVNGDDASSLSSQPTCSTTATKSSPVGGYTSTCSGAADANYSITYETGSVTVDQADLTITASDGSFTYGGTPANITAAYSGFVNGDDASKLSSQPTCSTTATKSSPVGSYASSCSGAADANYSIAYKTGSVTVGPAGLIVKASSPSFAYGGDPPAITPTYTGFVNGDNASSLDPQPTCSTVATKSSAVGSYASSCAGGADANYSFSYVDGTVTVSQADLTVTASDGSSTYGQDPPTITASYSGFVNGDSSSSLSTQPTCSTAATKSSPVGSYSSSCTGADDANYSISYTKGSVIVGPADLTVTASDGSSTYGQDPPTITASYSGFANGDSSLSLTTQPTCSTAATKSSPVGSYSSSCTGADDANYSISYTKGSVTVGPAGLTVTASSPSFTYGGTPPTITATYTGFVNGDSAASLDPQPTCSTGATHTSAVGSYASSCSGAADANYSMSYLDGSVSVNPANLTVTASSPSFTYGGTPPTITATYTGFVNNDSSSSLSKQPTCSTTASASSHVGSYPSSCTGAVDANYSMSYAPGSVTVNPAPLTVKASSPSFTYGGSPPTITASYAGFENGDSASSLSPEPSCSSVATKASPVGNYASSCAGAADANYSFSYLNGSVTVDPAPLTITASGGSFTYGGTPPAISVLGYSGFENGDSATNLSPQPSCSTVATELSPVGSYASSCSGAADANYSFSYVDGSVKVTQASLTVTASDATTTYGTPPTITAGYVGFVNTDSAANLTTKPVCSSDYTGSSPVGSYTSSCVGAVDPNYSFSYVQGSVTVNPAPLTVTASSGSFTYGGTVPTVTAIYTGLMNGDTASKFSSAPTCSTTATGTSPVGSYTSSCSGAADANYTVSYVAGAVTVNQATPTVAVSGQSGQGTGPVMVTVTVSGPSGVSAPTGSVTVTDATGSCSISALDSGTGACALVENYSEDGKAVTASYQGDTNYTAAAGTTEENVSLGTATVSVSAPTSAVTGTIYYDVTIGGQGAAPSGTVTISDGTKTSTGTPNVCTGPLVGDVASCPLAEATGTYQITATYSGDSNYATSAATVTEVVNETSTALVVSTNTLLYGLEQTATFSVTVYPPIGSPTAPSGTTVQLMAGTQILCVTSPLTPASIVVGLNPLGDPVSAAVGTATCHLAPAAVPAGTYTVAAEFPGQPGSFVGSTSSPAPLVVQSAPTTTAVSISRKTTTFESENNETVIAEVSEPTAGSSFVTGDVLIRNAARVICNATLSQGVATCKLTRAQLPVGHHAIVADYLGTTSLTASASTPVTMNVAKAATTSTLSVSSGTVSVASEKSLKLIASVTVPPGMTPATGRVVMMAGSTRLCAATLVHGKGTCSLSASELAVGRHSISAHYNGSTVLDTSVSRSRTLIVTKAASSGQ